MKPEDKPYVELGTTFSKGAIGAPVTDTQVEILRMLFEPDEAHLAASIDYLPEPEEAIAKRAGMSLEDAAELLTRMASRDLIHGVKRPDGVRVFRLPLFAPGLFEIVYINRVPSSDLEKLGDLFDKYFHEGWGREMHGVDAPMARVLPAVGPPKEKVVLHEDALKLVEDADFTMLIDCQCRQAVRRCDHPNDVCISLGTSSGGKSTPVRDPNYVVGEPQSRPVSADEAVDALKRAEAAGLVHVTMNFERDSWFICNCCADACILLRGASDLDIPHAVAPSSFWSVIEEDLCDGCAACEPVCPMLAITIEDHLAKVDYERCLGCGVCIKECPPQAIRFETRSDEIYTPYLDYNELVIARGKTHAVHTH
jgi:Pyruvate/2-oxoacid:ferredoxin oxidoreductase delta subunit